MMYINYKALKNAGSGLVVNCPGPGSYHARGVKISFFLRKLTYGEYCFHRMVNRPVKWRSKV